MTRTNIQASTKNISWLGIICFIVLAYFGKSILIPLVFAFFLSLALLPLVVRLEKRAWKKSIAILFSLLILMLMIIFVLAGISTQILAFSDEWHELNKNSLKLFDDLQILIHRISGWDADRQIDLFKNQLENGLENSWWAAEGIIYTTGSFLSSLVLIPIYIFCILYYRRIFVRGLYLMFPDKFHHSLSDIIRGIKEVLQKYFLGLLLVMLIIAVLNYIGLLICGLPHALFFAALGALLTLIPYIGIFIGSALPFFYGLTVFENPLNAIWILLVFSIVQLLEGNFITPRVIGSQVSLNPMIAILALLVGAVFWGITGMILFIPLTAIFKVICEHVPGLEGIGVMMGDRLTQKA